MKIYTKKGDQGKTSLLGGKKVSKSHDRINAYGSVDELNSYIGLVRDQEIDNLIKETLLHVQNTLFIIGSCLAADPEKTNLKIPELRTDDVVKLEVQIDAMTAALPPLQSFILPGGNVIASHCQVARTICRRAERNTCLLTESWETNPLILQFLNRLSDYLFVLSRKLCNDLGGEEILWNSGK